MKARKFEDPDDLVFKLKQYGIYAKVLNIFEGFWAMGS